MQTNPPAALLAQRAFDALQDMTNKLSDCVAEGIITAADVAALRSDNSIERLVLTGLPLELVRLVWRRHTTLRNEILSTERAPELLAALLTSSLDAVVATLTTYVDSGAPRSVALYVQQHHPEPLTATSVAAALQITPNAVRTQIRTATSMSFHNYLTDVRVRRALSLVASGTKVEAAALAVGYRSKGAFYTLVKRRFGASPLQLARSEQSTLHQRDPKPSPP